MQQPNLERNARYLLNKMARLISAGWCRGEAARTGGAKGLPCDVFSHRATHFCLGGALHRAHKDLHISNDVKFAVDNALEMELGDVGFFERAEFNDNRNTKKADVLALIEAARRHFE